MLAYLNALATVLAMVTFLGIVWWAFSSKRKKDNQESAMLPFDLPDEGAASEKQNEKVKQP